MKKFVGFALLFVALFVDWRVWSALHPAPVGGPLFSQLPPDQQAARRADLQNAVSQFDEVARAAKAGEKKPFTLVFSQDQLNTLLQDRLQTEKFPVKDISTALEADQLILQGTAPYKGFEVPATLTGSLKAEGGNAVFRVESLQVSGLPAPGDWKSKIETTVNKNLDKALKNGQTARIDSIQIEHEKLTISGVTG